MIFTESEDSSDLFQSVNFFSVKKGRSSNMCLVVGKKLEKLIQRLFYSK